jgi:thymidine phosphorylase
MDQPLAPCAGNAIEVRCVIDVLTSRLPTTQRPDRLIDVTFALGAEMLHSAGLAPTAPQALALLTEALRSGRAAEYFARMVVALGGPSDLLEHPDRHLAAAPCRRTVGAPSDGIVRTIDVRALGMVVVGLGGGRQRAGDAIDPSVGLEALAPLGRRVRRGDPIASVAARDEAAADRAATLVLGCYSIDDATSETTALPSIVERLG